MTASLAVATFGALSAGLLAVSLGSFRAERGSRESLHARYVCEAGLATAYDELTRGQPPALGTQQNPIAWGDGRYWVEATTPTSSVTRLLATALDGQGGARMELVVRRVPNTIFRYAAFGHEFLHMDSNARADSYDSNDGTYAAQAVNGNGSETWANENGHVGSNGNVSMDQNSNVWGNATAGPGMTTTVTGNAEVSGSTLPLEAAMALPPIAMPAIPQAGNAAYSGGANVLPSGDYGFDEFKLNTGAVLTVTGPARIVVNDFLLRSNSQFLVDATNGPVQIWVVDDFIMSSNTLISSNDQRAADVALNLLSDNVIDPDVIVDLDDVDLNSGSRMYGTIYAPEALIEVRSNFELFGSMVARQVDLDSNCQVHFDEDLLESTSSGDPDYQTVLWRPLPYRAN